LCPAISTERLTGGWKRLGTGSVSDRWRCIHEFFGVAQVVTEG
jgi:hypothetical protein